MKKISTFIMLTFIYVNSYAQTNEDSTKHKSTHPVSKVDSVSTSTPLLTISDLNELMTFLSKNMHIDQGQLYQSISKFLADKVQLRSAEYYQKPKTK